MFTPSSLEDQQMTSEVCLNCPNLMFLLILVALEIEMSNTEAPREFLTSTKASHLSPLTQFYSKSPSVCFIHNDTTLPEADALCDQGRFGHESKHHQFVKKWKGVTGVENYKGSCVRGFNLSGIGDILNENQFNHQVLLGRGRLDFGHMLPFPNSHPLLPHIRKTGSTSPMTQRAVTC